MATKFRMPAFKRLPEAPRCTELQFAFIDLECFDLAQNHPEPLSRFARRIIASIYLACLDHAQSHPGMLASFDHQNFHAEEQNKTATATTGRIRETLQRGLTRDTGGRVYW